MKTKMLIPTVSALSLAFVGGIAGCSDDDSAKTSENDGSAEEDASQNWLTACAKLEVCTGYDYDCDNLFLASTGTSSDPECIDLVDDYANCLNRKTCDEIVDYDCEDEYDAWYYACDF